ncbi:P-loop NTPase fold protein [Agrobacterium rubi]|uniref:P-loop NTPase fold protein n=1 Tax=Agrobacterium rubi TaxID=28099 RepID=UPI001571EC64|nr:P-loop NTPase fold protein [Agrobacterium rubi]
MSTAQVKKEITRFLNSEETLTLCLSGKWGVGKTHTWNALLKEAFENGTVRPTNYAYASLFGLESLKNVRKTVFENTVGAAAFTEKKQLEATVASVSERLGQMGTKWRAVAGFVRGIPIVADYDGLTEAGFLDVRDQIVCFDDLERMSDSLKIKDVLGLISLLKEKKRCKVVLLLNRDALEGQDAEDFRVQLEKVIDINLEYDPTAIEAVEIAIPTSQRSNMMKRLVAENTTKLGIKNIRTIFKLLRICKRLEEILSGYDPRVVTKSFHSACLFGYALYQPTEAPPLDKIMGPYVYLLPGHEVEKKTPEQIQQSEVLARYGFNTADDFDRAILDSIRTGVYNEGAIRQEADAITKNLTLSDRAIAFHKTWNIAHDSFDDNADAFAEELKQSIRDNAIAIAPQNLSAAIGILKKLGHTKDTAEIIQVYVDSRDDDKEFWIGDPVSHFDMNDPDVLAAFAAKANQFQDDRTLQEVTKEIVQSGSWSPSKIAFLDNHTADDFYNALKNTKGEKLRQLAYGLTFFRQVTSEDDRLHSITAKAVEALTRIGRESNFNRMRVEKFGISVSEDQNKVEKTVADGHHVDCGDEPHA